MARKAEPTTRNEDGQTSVFAWVIFIARKKRNILK